MSMSRLTELLESFAKRPQMYVSRLTLETVQSYLLGLQRGLEIANVPCWTNDDEAAEAKARGWSILGNIGIRRDFMAKSLTERDMALEYAAIIRDAYIRACARTANREPS